MIIIVIIDEVHELTDGWTERPTTTTIKNATYGRRRFMRAARQRAMTIPLILSQLISLRHKFN